MKKPVKNTKRKKAKIRIFLLKFKKGAIKFSLLKFSLLPCVSIIELYGFLIIYCVIDKTQKE